MHEELVKQIKASVKLAKVFVNYNIHVSRFIVIKSFSYNAGECLNQNNILKVTLAIIFKILKNICTFWVPIL